jgi:hypothetical protein
MHEEKPFIVFEDFGGISLKYLMTTKSLCLEECLTIA